MDSYVALARATLARVVTDGRVLPIRALKINELLDAAQADAAVRARSRGLLMTIPYVVRTRGELDELLAARRAAGDRGRLRADHGRAPRGPCQPDPGGP